MIFTHQPSIAFLCLIGMAITAVAAAITDWLSWRIPNLLLAASASAALMIAAFDPHSLTLTQALLGGLSGFAMLLPFYMARGMSAGDVKLMSVIGLYVGPMLIVDIALASFLIGGLWSLAILIARSPSIAWALLGLKSLMRVDAKQQQIGTAAPDGLKTRRGVFPFGVAIGIATLAMVTTVVIQGR